jgi:phosphatidylserine/phosphatidylglycerophosphate/cardiolipin synthase-like enzyme
MMSSKLTFIDSPTYFKQLVKAIDHTTAGDRIALATMAFRPTEPTIAHLLDRLRQAAKRGVTVTFCFDAFALMVDDHEVLNGPLAPRGFRKTSLPYFAHMTAAIKQLKAAGVTVGITNIPKKSLHIPYGGRSHIKGAVVNSQWWIGGCNFASATNSDAMTGAQDKATADYVYELFCGFAKNGSVIDTLGSSDVTRKLSENTALLVDVGVRNQSCIYDEALRLIDAADQWIVFTCQSFPSGKTAAHLARAVKRGVHVRVIFNGPDKKQLGGVARKIYQHVSHRGLPRSLFDDELDTALPYIHAKILATDGGMIIGSHNMISQGVTLGTAEIAITSSDIDMIISASKLALQLAETTS